MPNSTPLGAPLKTLRIPMEAVFGPGTAERGEGLGADERIGFQHPGRVIAELPNGADTHVVTRLTIIARACRPPHSDSPSRNRTPAPAPALRHPSSGHHANGPKVTLRSGDFHESPPRSTLRLPRVEEEPAGDRRSHSRFGARHRSQHVELRLGIRMALGAGRADILAMALAAAVRMGAIGLAIGVPATLAMLRAMSSALYGVMRIDAGTFIGLSLLLAASAVAAGYIPAHRAARVDALTALRAE